MAFLLIAAYPQVRKAWHEVKYSQAWLENFKQRLEIAKLQCEIDVLVKQHGLAKPKELLEPIGETATPLATDGLSRSKQFTYGLAGAALPFLLRLLQHDAPAPSATFILFSLAVLLGGGLWAVTMESRTPWVAIYTGVSFPLIFSYLTTSPLP